MLELNAKTTALVVIDLQKASYLLPEVHILPMRWLIAREAGGEISRQRSARVSGARCWSADYAEALKQPVDAPSPAKCCPKTGGNILLH